LALFAALVVQALVAARPSPARDDGAGSANGNARVRIAAPAGVAVALVAAGLGLSQVTWTVPANAPLTVRLL
ncbi:apolipoprotein N-acyltransferase, partial [Escherichia coli]